jgi:hypothetical protein
MYVVLVPFFVKQRSKLEIQSFQLVVLFLMILVLASQTYYYAETPCYKIKHCFFIQGQKVVDKTNHQ